jgi:hypothetical protein
VKVASCRRPRRSRLLDDTLPVPDRAAGRYFDRETRTAQLTAELCTTVARQAGGQGKGMLAALLHDFAAEFADEARFLAVAADPGVRWPVRLESHGTPGHLDEAIDAVVDELQHSERTLRWIARRPDLPGPAAVAFEALATARCARRRVLSVCREIDGI